MQLSFPIGAALAGRPCAQLTDALRLVATAIEKAVNWAGQAHLVQPFLERLPATVKAHGHIVERYPEARGDPVARLSVPVVFRSVMIVIAPIRHRSSPSSPTESDSGPAALAYVLSGHPEYYAVQRARSLIQIKLWPGTGIQRFPGSPASAEEWSVSLTKE
jgi:hypothetical protein